jgi:hypothetical protein
LAHKLRQAGHNVTILNDGQPVGGALMGIISHLSTLAALKDAAHPVTVLRRPPAVCLCVQEKLASKPPFSQYGELEKQGVQVTWGNPVDPKTFPQGKFDVVYDNNGKDLETCKPLIDHFQVPNIACL